MNASTRTNQLFGRFIVLNLLAIMLVCICFRVVKLGNIPGINGDEAWYGVQAVNMLHDAHIAWRTPTGNPLNFLFFGPLLLLNWMFSPGIVLLRSVAVASGVLALLLNWLLCSWVYDRRMAWISTVFLAILPINIAYSRFAWDACQSLAVDLPVVYLSLASVRFARWRGRLIFAALLCQAVATLVHPTNIFVGAAIVTAAAARADSQKFSALFQRRIMRPAPLCIAILVVALLVMGIWSFWLVHTPLPNWLNARLRSTIFADSIPLALVRFARLFTGPTVYHYLAGSWSWLQWPSSADASGFGVDVLAFWLLLAFAGITLWRRWKSDAEESDGVLIAAWTMTLAVFLVFAGSRAMIPGQERFALCLVPVTAIFICRALSLTLCSEVRSGRIALLCAVAAGWLVLADFDAHYFRFIQRTGGESHRTFRTGETEPKKAAIDYILAHRKPGETWILAPDWWLFWPMKYFASAENGLRVLEPAEAENMPEKFLAAKHEDRLWLVKFAIHDSAQKYPQCISAERVPCDINDYAGRPILWLFHCR